MDEVIEYLAAILNELREINERLDDIKGFGVQGSSLADVCDKLENLDTTITLAS